MILLRTLAELDGGKVFFHTFSAEELDMRVAACAPSFTLYSPEARFEVLIFLNTYPQNPPDRWLPRGDLISFVLSGYGENVVMEACSRSTLPGIGNGLIQSFEIDSAEAVLTTDTAQLKVFKPNLLVGSASPIRGSNVGLAAIGKTLGRISIYK